MDEFYLVKYGRAEPKRFDAREEAELYAQRQAVLPFVQRIRNGNGKMDQICDVLISQLDDISIAIASAGNHIKKYVETEE